jgi:hypothetical protein
MYQLAGLAVPAALMILGGLINGFATGAIADIGAVMAVAGFFNVVIVRGVVWPWLEDADASREQRRSSN